MQAVGVLGGGDGIDGFVLVQPLGQRQLEEDAVDRRIGVDLPDRLRQLGLGAAGGKEEIARGDADVVGRALLVADVDLGGGVLADEDDGERGLHPGRGRESGHSGLHLGQDLRRDGPALEDLHRS